MNDTESDEETETRLGFLVRVIQDDAQRASHLGAPGALRLNLMTEEIELGGRRFGVEDSDLVPVRMAVAKSTKRAFGKAIEPSVQNLRAALEYVAGLNCHHPVEDWVTSLTWDNEDRLTGGLPAAFGQEPGTLEASMLRKTMRAMVARVLKPGCQVDTVLVLTGAQGKFKSTALGALANPWFTDQSLDLSNKDTLDVCHRHWLLELGELSAVRAAKDIEQVKAFVSRRDDTWRSSYARKPRTRSRRFILVGTTNQVEFLQDSTGNRRFWPITIGDKRINVEYLRAQREQLFAQAAKEVLVGATWWLDDEEDIGHLELSERHMEVDPWSALIAEWMGSHQAKGKLGVAMSDVLSEACSQPGQHMHSGSARRAACAIRAHGGHLFKSDGRRLWRW